jgi:hypothetical protein
MPADGEQSPVHELEDDDGARHQPEEVAEGPEEEELERAHRGARRRGGPRCTSPVYEALG